MASTIFYTIDSFIASILFSKQHKYLYNVMKVSDNFIDNAIDLILTLKICRQ